MGARVISSAEELNGPPVSVGSRIRAQVSLDETQGTATGLQLR